MKKHEEIKKNLQSIYSDNVSLKTELDKLKSKYKEMNSNFKEEKAKHELEVNGLQKELEYEKNRAIWQCGAKVAAITECEELKMDNDDLKNQNKCKDETIQKFAT